MSFVEPIFPGIAVCGECVIVSQFMCQMVSELLWVDVQFAENGQMVSLICANVVFFRENYNGSLRNFVITVKRYVKLIDRCICLQDLPDRIGVCLVKIPDRDLSLAGMETLCFVDQFSWRKRRGVIWYFWRKARIKPVLLPYPQVRAISSMVALVWTSSSEALAMRQSLIKAPIVV